SIPTEPRRSSRRPQAGGRCGSPTPARARVPCRSPPVSLIRGPAQSPARGTRSPRAWSRAGRHGAFLSERKAQRIEAYTPCRPEFKSPIGLGRRVSDRSCSVADAPHRPLLLAVLHNDVLACQRLDRSVEGGDQLTVDRETALIDCST